MQKKLVVGMLGSALLLASCFGVDEKDENQETNTEDPAVQQSKDQDHKSSSASVKEQPVEQEQEQKQKEQPNVEQSVEQQKQSDRSSLSEDQKVDEQLTVDDRETNETQEKLVDSSSPKNNQSTTEEKAEDSTDKKGKDEEMTTNGMVLKSLSNSAYEIQDNTITDTWGVVLVFDQLPTELQSKKGYTITVGDQTYDLELNRFNSNIYSGQVSSSEHTKEEVENGVIAVK
ncbi:hypothetical protein [Bacillus sp. FJAT-42315]|uniref:hypothetical protein n=1 Tax=Bacillus sp. FJAT-42315 TaxID=2014077 RepID=UPI000C247268|nr:hypothetical protein [Bacillus sp. FJAT-42315]